MTASCQVLLTPSSAFCQTRAGIQISDRAVAVILITELRTVILRILTVKRAGRATGRLSGYRRHSICQSPYPVIGSLPSTPNRSRCNPGRCHPRRFPSRRVWTSPSVSSQSVLLVRYPAGREDTRVALSGSPYPSLSASLKYTAPSNSLYWRPISPSRPQPETNTE